MTHEYDLECRQLVRRYDKFIAVDHVSFQIPQGSFFSILGPSGCGKTTLLRMIAGFDHPDSGDIHIKGLSMRGVPSNKRPVNMVFQHLALFPMMTVAENIAYGLKRRGIDPSAISKKVQAALEKVNLPESGNKQISQLSGGQKQRIAIARCLVLEPSVLLLDEPLGALDLKLREHMKVELKQLQHQVGTTFVYITHDQSEALVMSDQVAIMNKGRFEQVDTPQALYYEPQTAFVADFVGETNQWQAKHGGNHNSAIALETESGFGLTAAASENIKAGDSVSVFVRPEAISLSHKPRDNAENQLLCRVEDVLFNGANSRVILNEEKFKHKLTVALPQTGEYANLKRNETLYASWDAVQTKCFRQSPK